jgi:hypothetical protein
MAPKQKHYSYGDRWLNRVQHLVKALVQCAWGEVEAPKALSLRWADDDPKTHQLIVRTTLQGLEYLCQQVPGDHCPQKEPIRDCLRHYLPEYLGILTDNRAKNVKGSPNWHFTLTLCSREVVANQDRIAQLWAAKHPKADTAPAPSTPTQQTATATPMRLFQVPELPRYYVHRPRHFEAG